MLLVCKLQWLGKGNDDDATAADALVQDDQHTHKHDLSDLKKMAMMMILPLYLSVYPHIHKHTGTQDCIFLDSYSFPLPLSFYRFFFFSFSIYPSIHLCISTLLLAWLSIMGFRSRWPLALLARACFIFIITKSISFTAACHDARPTGQQNWRITSNIKKYIHAIDTLLQILLLQRMMRDIIIIMFYYKCLLSTFLIFPISLTKYTQERMYIYANP